MFPVRLIYVSTVVPTCDPDDIDTILHVARRANAQADISGLLCFTTDYFIQCLEGPRDAVNQLYVHILNDWRHTRPVLLEYVEIAARVFDNWSMAYLSPSDEIQDVLQKYAEERDFNPYRLDAVTAFSLMTDLGTLLQRADWVV